MHPSKNNAHLKLEKGFVDARLDPDSICFQKLSFLF